MKKVFCFLLAFGALLMTGCARGEARLWAVGVGKGDAILIQNEDCTVLIDTGKGYAAGKLRRAMAEMGVEKLDAVFLTHVDNDHAGGLTYLAQSGIPVDAWYASPCFFKFKKKKHPIRQIGQEPQWLEAGATVRFGETEFQVLAPLSKSETEENDNSLVLMMVCPDGRMLLTGDMEGPEEDALLQGGADLACQVLKVPNHGDDDATGAGLANAAGAQIAVISTDSSEKPGTPDADVIARLEQAGSQVWVTEGHGGVEVRLNQGAAAAGYLDWALSEFYDDVRLTVDAETERMTLENTGDKDVSLKDWYLYSEAGNELFLLGNETLPAGGQLVVGTKSSPEGTYDVLWNEKNVISNKKQDTVTLYDPEGRGVSAY